MPADRAYVCRIRTDVPAAAIQWLDLKPNTSQRNLVYEKVPQTGYLLARAASDTVVAAGTVTAADYSGLAAYLIDRVQDEVSGFTLAPATVNGAATTLLGDLDAGNVIDGAAVTAALVGAGAGAATALDGTGSTGDLADVLKILSGGDYTLPAGHDIDPGTALAAQGGSFDDDGYRQLYLSGALQMSCAEGDLAGFADAAFEYDGTAGAALAVYRDDGSLLT
jgi:hypothetical protein